MYQKCDKIRQFSTKKMRGDKIRSATHKHKSQIMDFIVMHEYEFSLSKVVQY